MLREAKDLAKKYASFEGFYNAFGLIFGRIKRVREKQLSLKTRTKWKDKLKLEMEQIIEQMNSYREFRRFATTVKNGLEQNYKKKSKSF